MIRLHFRDAHGRIAVNFHACINFGTSAVLNGFRGGCKRIGRVLGYGMLRARHREDELSEEIRTCAVHVGANRA